VERSITARDETVRNHDDNHKIN